MRVSLEWLREWVDPGQDVPGLANALTMAGLEIEAIERAAPEMSGIVVGKVESVEKHPDADKLRVCTVAAGAETLQIVCGASNVRAGMLAPLARVGARLPDGTVIKKAKLRGVESFGMLCSARELGLSEDGSGLLELPDDLPVGEDLVAALALDDTVFDIALTPNRGDCMSVLGVAREVAAARRQSLNGPSIAQVAATIEDTFPIRLENSGCPKFVGRVIRGLRAGAQSPLWMRERLRRAGLRPVSAVVDVTNYVMLELGQPMHAYDLQSLTGSIVVRAAQAGETLELLDGRTVELSPDVMVIADERAPLGLAGIMGGEASGISDATTDVFLEVAYFEPAAIAGRARRYGLLTDAAQRFERGVDPQLQERAIERATRLLLDCAGGSPGPVTVARTGAGVTQTPSIRLRHERVQRVLGTTIAPDVVVDCLRRLGMTVESSGAPPALNWQVQAPSWRFDVRIEEDLIEEVARLYGFDRIPEVDAVGAQILVECTEARVRTERAADLLVDRGYQEAITYSFTDAASQAILHPDEPALALANPISAELGVMRVSLWPGLVHALRENQRRQQTRVRLFECGRRFDATGKETEVIAGIACGPVSAEQWDAPARAADFFDIKADVEALLTLTGEPDAFRFVAERHPALHPGQSARIYRGEQAVGWLGAMHPERARRLDLTYPVFLFELETMIGLAARIPKYAEISRFPAIRRDIAVIVADEVPAEALRDVVRESGGALLTEVAVLSVYRGQQIDKGKKSIALGLHLQDTSRTLTDQEADAIVARVVEALSRQLGASIRDK